MLHQVFVFRVYLSLLLSCFRNTPILYYSYPSIASRSVFHRPCFRASLYSLLLATPPMAYRCRCGRAILSLAVVCTMKTGTYVARCSRLRLVTVCRGISATLGSASGCRLVEWNLHPYDYELRRRPSKRSYRQKSCPSLGVCIIGRRARNANHS